MDKCSRLMDGDIRNETELRCVIGDPIMEYICTIGNGKVCFSVLYI